MGKLEDKVALVTGGTYWPGFWAAGSVLGHHWCAALGAADDNVKAADVTLTVEDLGHLDALTKPTFEFPQKMQPIFPPFNGGTTVNGVYAQTTSFGVQKADRVNWSDTQHCPPAPNPRNRVAAQRALVRGG